MAERKINLGDMMINALIHWRLALVAMLAGGLLLGAYSYVSSVSAAKTQQERKEELTIQLEELQQGVKKDESAFEEAFLDAKGQLTDSEIAYVEQIVAEEKVIQQKESYLEKSVYMQMDSTNIQRAELTYWISATELDMAYNIQRVYEDMARGGEMYTYLAQKTNIEEAAVAELITLEDNSANYESGTNVLRIQILHGDEKACATIAGYVKTYIEEQYKELYDVIGEHQITLLEESYSTAMSSTILDRQKQYMTDIYTSQSGVDTKKDSFSKEQGKYYEILSMKEDSVNGEDSSVNPEMSKVMAELEEIVVEEPGISLKYVVVGVAMALVIYLVFIILGFIFNVKLSVTDDLQAIYNIPFLGVIPKDNSKKKIGKAIDKWIRSLQLEGGAKYTTDEKVQLLGTEIVLTLKKKELNSVCLVGCNITERTKAVCEKLEALLKKESIHVKILENIAGNDASLKELMEVGGAIVIEPAGLTHYKEVEQELDLLKRQDAFILGGVVVE